jgi:hypothetical protein
MSLFVYAKATCGQCGETTALNLAASVNADRRPDLRREIIAGTFQALTCAGCGAALRLPAHLSYLDVGRGQWILTEGIERLADWRTVENDARGIFDRSYGDAAPPLAREIGASLRPRLVFGWPALREKLICDELRLEDVTLELLKIAMFRAIPDPPYADGHELRLIRGDDTVLHFAWFEPASEQQLASTSLGREIYDEIKAAPAPWAALRADLQGKIFVDFKRLIFA